MAQKIPFTKMQGAGNDFILIDNRHNYFTGSESSLFAALCHRHYGIGGDGIMLINFDDPQNFELQYFNASGKPAEMCGNGARCAVHFVHNLFPEYKFFEFRISAQTYQGNVTGKQRAKIFWEENPKIMDSKDLAGEISQNFESHLFVHSGVPHLILKADKPLESIDVMNWGNYYRYHDFFQPAGTNVNFIRILKDKIKIRTFERGVEGETLACGTGAVAAALAVVHWGLLDYPVEVQATGGKLKVGYDFDKSSVWLEGPVQITFRGEFDIHSLDV